MSKTTINVLVNIFLLVIFLILDSLALKKGLEETFIFLTLAYGIVVIILNTYFIAKKSHH